jgi:O-antigen/teichoic acid export membrane protein
MNGLISTIEQFIQYFNLLDGGIAVAAAISLYEPIYRNDIKKINGIISALRKFYIKAGILFSIVNIILAFTLPFFLKDQLEELTVFSLTIILGLSSLYTFFIAGKYNVLFIADGKSYIKNNILAFTRILSLIMQYIVIYLNGSIVDVKFLGSIAVIIGFIPLFIYFKMFYPNVYFRAIPDIQSLSKKWDALIIQVSMLARKSAPIIIITMFFLLENTSVFSVYAMIFQTGNSLLEMLSQSITANFGNIIVSGDNYKLKKFYNYCEFILYTFTGVISICFLLLTIPFVKLYTKGITGINYCVPVIVYSFIISEALQNFAFTPRTVIAASGEMRCLRNSAVVETLSSIIIGIVGVKLFGMPGVLLGTIVGNLYRYCIVLLFSLKKIVILNVKSELFKRIRYIIVILIAIALSFIVHININNYYQWIVYAITIFSVSTLIIFIGNCIVDRKFAKDFYNFLCTRYHWMNNF